MAQLLVRNLEEAVVERLREEAARERISVEEAHRRVLRRMLLPEESKRTLGFKEVLRQMPLPEKYEHLFERQKTRATHSGFLRMMEYLLDTNILSEIRKGARAALSVQSWFDAVPAEQMFVSVMVVGEIKRGIELMRRRDPVSASHLERWLAQLVESSGPRMLPVTVEIADRWGGLSPTQRLPAVDGLMAATALVYDLTLVTRNTRDFERSGVRMFNPFSSP